MSSHMVRMWQVLPVGPVDTGSPVSVLKDDYIRGCSLYEGISIILWGVPTLGGPL